MCIAGFLSSGLLAQQKTKGLQDVLYLKNESVIRGKIIEHEIGKTVKIETSDGSVWVFQYDDIEKMTAEKPIRAQKHKGPKEIKFPQKGYYNLTQIHLWIADPGREDWYDFTTAPAISNISGYRFSEHLSTGMGIGVDIYERGLMMPLFADIRGDLFKAKQVSPHYSGQIGYSFPLTQNEITNWQGQLSEAENKGGMRYGANVGIHIYTASNISWLISMGYHYQRSEVRYDGWRFENERITERFTHKRLSFQIGLMF